MIIAKYTPQLRQFTVALFVLIYCNHAAYAQSTLLPAPTFLTMSPTGVDMHTGGVVWQNAGVSVGGDDGFSFIPSLRNGSSTSFPILQSNWT